MPKINANEIHQTGAAVLLEIDGEEHWFPLSQVYMDEDGFWDIPQWLLNAKNIEYYDSWADEDF